MSKENYMNKDRFKNSVANIVIGEIKRNYKFEKKIDVKIQRKGNAIHLLLKRFPDSFEVFISRDCNIEIIVQGVAPHGPIAHEYYVWDDFDNHEELLLQIKKDMKLLIRDFFDGMEGYVLCDPRIFFSLQGEWSLTYELLRCYGLHSCYNPKKIKELRKALCL